MTALIIAELKFIEEILGNQTEVANYLKIEPSKLAGWKKGDCAPSDEIEERIVELRLVIVKLRAIYSDDVILGWLLGSNPMVNFCRPLDLIAKGRLVEVLNAIEQEKAGSYA